MSDLQNALKFKAELLKTYISGAIKNAKDERFNITKTMISGDSSTVWGMVLSYSSNQFNFTVPLYCEEDLTRDFSEFKIMSTLYAFYRSTVYLSNVTMFTVGDIVSENNKIGNLLFCKPFSAVKKKIYEKEIRFGGKDYHVTITPTEVKAEYHIIVNKTTSTIVLNYSLLADLKHTEEFMRVVKSRLVKIRTKQKEIFEVKVKELVKDLNDYKETL